MAKPKTFFIRNARAVDAVNHLKPIELSIQGQTIAHVGPPGSLHPTPDADILDAQNQLVLPGFIDCHVHLRDSGASDSIQRAKEDFSTGTKAAIAGGVTTVLDMPNTNPPTATPEAFQTKLVHARRTAYCDFGLFAGATNDNANTVHQLVHDGAVAVKMYMGASTGSLLVDAPGKEEPFFKSAADHGFVLALHAESQDCLKRHEALFNETKKPRHSQVRPPQCAEHAVEAAMQFIRKYENQTYICHASTAQEVELVRHAKTQGLPVFMEACTHHLFLTADEELYHENRVKMNPPLRSKHDVDALWKALNDGTIDTVATDHAPHTLQEKNQNYWEAPAGVPGLETLMPLMLSAALQGKTTLETVQKTCCENPAKIFGLNQKGQLKPGLDADLVFVDLDTEKPVDESTLFTRCGWSPYTGKRLRGWPTQVLLRGQTVYANGFLHGPLGRSVK
ncbi:dihydroorotase family protein [Candidatus Micrarchaeota archaeon]|nr:dihydroorotase family protein [Candidatus Micrarchaeota archaeon]